MDMLGRNKLSLSREGEGCVFPGCPLKQGDPAELLPDPRRHPSAGA